MVRGRASERLLEAGYGEDDVERILELVPIATHNQRGRGTLYVGTDDGLVWRTGNAGAHWQDVTPKQLSSWSKIGRRRTTARW